MDKDNFENEGWEMRGVYDEPRLSEICELYESLGFDVMLIDYSSNNKNAEICNACFSQTEGKSYKIVYTRGKK